MFASMTIISEQKCKDISKQIMIINSRLKGIQGTLGNSPSNLSEGISRIILDLNEVLVESFIKYKLVSVENTIDALGDAYNGELCIEVHNALQKSDRKTPLDIILRGLLSPEGIHSVRKLALVKARKELELFQKDIEILLVVTKKGKTVKSQVKKTERLKIIKNNLNEFDSAKEVLDRDKDIRKLSVPLIWTKA